MFSNNIQQKRWRLEPIEDDPQGPRCTILLGTQAMKSGIDIHPTWSGILGQPCRCAVVGLSPYCLQIKMMETSEMIRQMPGFHRTNMTLFDGFGAISMLHAAVPHAGFTSDVCIQATSTVFWCLVYNGTSKISSRRSPLQIKLFVHIILKGTAFYSELILLGEVLSLSSNGCVKVHIMTREAQHNLINMSMYHALVVGRDRMSSGFSTSNHIFWVVVNEQHISSSHWIYRFILPEKADESHDKLKYCWWKQELYHLEYINPLISLDTMWDIIRCNTLIRYRYHCMCVLL